MENVKLSLHSYLKEAQVPLVVILGPTASGKTSFSIQLAKELQKEGQNPEIINGDSRQLYRSLDIGTAKITKEEMQGIPHHLFSMLDPSEPVSIAWYQREAAKVIDEIRMRGSLPILVGGSMLYISSVIDGLVPVDQSDLDLRKKLAEEYDRDGGVTSWKRLEELDPESAENIPRENKIYVVRALEIIELTGKKKSEQQDCTASPYDLFIIGIDQDREVLKGRIIERTKHMFEKGWIDEVERLMNSGYDESSPAMQSHGYREIMQAIQSGSINQDALIDSISKNSIAYAKRQRTWWRGDERIHWIQPLTAF